MSVGLNEYSVAPGEQAWTLLTALESLHRDILRNHERLLRDLDQASSAADRADLQVAWNQYRAVVADLGRVTAEMESLRLTMS
jgi:hypothetical protein